MANESKNDIITKSLSSNSHADSGKLKEEMMEFFDIFCRISADVRNSNEAIKKTIRFFLGANNRPMGFTRKGFWLVGNQRELNRAVESLIGGPLKDYLKNFNVFPHTEVIPGSFLLANQRGNIIGMLYFGSGISENFVNCYGPEEICQGFVDIVSAFFTAPLPETVERLSLNVNKAVVGRNKRLESKRTISDYKGFWPYFSTSPSELAEEFDKSNNNVLVLYGAPGLGKSQFIREMIRWKNQQKQDNIIVADTTDVLTSPGLIPCLHDLDDGSWFITEDQQVMLERRESGNSLMSGLLNAVEGITSGNVKFIISTNILNLKGVDDAIIRPGRLFKALPFRALTPEEANCARAAVNYPPVDFNGRKDVTLAEALNWENTVEMAKLTKTSFL